MGTITKKVVWIKNSAYLPLSKETWYALGLDERKETELSMMMDTSKHGIYLGVWNPEKQELDKAKREVQDANSNRE